MVGLLGLCVGYPFSYRINENDCEKSLPARAARIEMITRQLRYMRPMVATLVGSDHRHFEKIRLYESAQKYLNVALNGRKEIPVKAWQAEQATLTAERFSLCEDYYRLKDETRSVEVLRKGAVNIMREEYNRAQSPHRHNTER